VLDRAGDKAYIDANASINRFPDVSSSHWAYYDIMEATVSHDFVKETDGSMTWTRVR